MSPLARRALGPAILALAAATGACTHKVKVEPIKVEPIDITLHIYLEADEKLDSFFAYQDQPATSTEAPAGQPTEGGRE